MEFEATIHGVGVSVGEGGVGAPAVLLGAREEIVPIFIDQAQAATIERGRTGMAAERPLTHDLFMGVLDDLQVTLERVVIDDLVDGTFHATLDLLDRRGDRDERLQRDARPSDGIALAVRVGCPILLVERVIDEAGQSPEALGLTEGNTLDEPLPREGTGASHGGESASHGEVADAVPSPPPDSHIDLHADPDEIRILADLPGVNAEDIVVRSDGERVDIDAESADREYHERIDLPDTVSPATAEAGFNNGVLEVRLDTGEPSDEWVPIPVT